jgi:FAD/FMN-containing dehydrogenase
LVVSADLALRQVQDMVTRSDLLFPCTVLDLEDAPLRTLIAADATGVEGLRYGRLRHLVTGVRAYVGGRPISTLAPPPLPGAGLALTQVLLAAPPGMVEMEAVRLALVAPPQEQALALVALTGLEEGLILLSDLNRAFGPPMAYEVLDQAAMDLGRTQAPDGPLTLSLGWTALIAVGGGRDAGTDEALQQVLGEALDSGLIVDARLAHTAEEQSRFWSLRRAAGLGPGVDLIAPPALLPARLAQIRADLNGVAVVGPLGQGRLRLISAEPVAASLPAEHLAPDTEAVWHQLLAGLAQNSSAAASGSVKPWP